MKPKIILLDWDGTLADVYPITRDAMNATRADRRIHPLHEADAKVTCGLPLPEMFPDEEDRARFIAHHARISSETPPTPIPGSPEFIAYLQTLRQAGIYVGIVSNKPHALIEKECKQFGWEGCFDTIVGSDDTIKSKPDPMALDKALEHYPNREKLHPSEIIFIGDTNTDLKFARNTGMRFMGVGDRINEPSLLCESCANLPQMHKRIAYLLRNVSTDRAL